MSDIRKLHQDLLVAIDSLAELTSRTNPDEAALATARYRLSRLSSERRRFVEALCADLGTRVSAEDAQALQALRDDTAASRFQSSAHVTGWSLRDVLNDWPGYCAASSKMRQSMLEQIEREKQLLYPHL